jgi:hypothetical protein
MDQYERYWTDRLENMGLTECETCLAVVRIDHRQQHENQHDQEYWRRMGEDL